ncbi:MAG: methyltransferase domain-containing protein [Desulfobacterales bacterium]|nr:methyltransferase domain-containing protein [Desulfobacterales bacterium]
MQASHESPLEIRSVFDEGGGDILEGILICPNPQCLSEYPVIDGIPVIVADLRAYISHNLVPILARTDLTDQVESLLGDCCGPGSVFDMQRQHMSIYAFDHYGDLDPEQPDNAQSSPGAVLRLLEKGLKAAGNPVAGPVLDVGCSVGRTSFALAHALDAPVLGVDLNFDMLRTARRVLHKGVVRYPMRREGIVYDRREFPAAFEKAGMVDFWACDATMLPFASETFGLGVSLNVLDCVSSPYEHLQSLSRILMPDAHAVISTPYDWSASATPVESWLGGHSQRSEMHGASQAMLRSLLTQGSHPMSAENLEPISEFEAVPWSVRVHDRCVMQYFVHMIIVRKGKNPCIAQ